MNRYKNIMNSMKLTVLCATNNGDDGT